MNQTLEYDIRPHFLAIAYGNWRYGYSGKVTVWVPSGKVRMECKGCS
jgi:hypothetical protein